MTRYMPGILAEYDARLHWAKNWYQSLANVDRYTCFAGSPPHDMSWCVQAERRDAQEWHITARLRVGGYTQEYVGLLTADEILPMLNDLRDAARAHVEKWCAPGKAEKIIRDNCLEKPE